ncbi:PC-esterase domain-containing protein 1A-like [Acanthaster planci]|uniref:PC-esterase domain-containing protein 1A-like n=1 Tax=Acanthaster planci TaxID=133434 RepID=A0A8B7XKT8_ACAPL|nr:PC-esterase domain-containing protein 1A-like [Acanthaster planci]
MAIFLHEDVVNLLWNKFVVIIGDSIQRSIYKDLVSLLQTNTYLSENSLKKKGELSFMDDVLIEGGKKEEMSNGINYREVRQYKTDYHLVRFYFVTRAYNKYVETIFIDLAKEPKPDVVLMNSCLWDISRYGPNSMKAYKTNLEKTFYRMQKTLEPDCLFLWNTALPVANKIRGGFLLPELEFLSETLRLDVMEGNFYAKELASAFDFDVLDLHFYFRFQLHRRVADGVHWNHQAHRRMSNLILSHISEAWGLSVPRRLEAWHQPPSVPPQSPVVFDITETNFHTDIALSAPPQAPRARRNSLGDDWGNVNQFIDFDKVASPKEDPTCKNPASNTTTRPPTPSSNNKVEKHPAPTPPMPINSICCNANASNGPMRPAAQHRQATRYNPYGGGHTGGLNMGHGGRYNSGPGGPWRAAPFWKELEDRRRQRMEWERQQQVNWNGFCY